MDEGQSCSRGLYQQPWYWPNATKEDIAQAMQDSPNGTFCVRDASIKGDFTLTLRIGQRNRLVRILVQDGRCGFTQDALKFGSLIDLIDYYKRNSLVEFNRQLTTELLYPLEKPTDINNIWVIDGVHSTEHLFCQLRGIHAGHIRIIRRDDQISSHLDLMREDLQRKRQSRAAFWTASSLFVKQLEILKSNRALLSEEAEIAQLDSNKKIQQKRLESIRLQQEQMNEQIDVIERCITENEALHNSLMPKLSRLHKELDTCQFRLCQLNIQQPFVDKTLQEVSFLAELEQDPVTRILLQLSVRWEPDRYLTLDCTKEKALKIIRSLMDCNPDNADGIFLIRPSQSQTGHYALTISKDNHIYNCLIEYRDFKHPESSGYAFLNTRLFFPTLVDFVRYYSNCSMKEHNAQLDTKLKIPAFKGTL